MLALPVEPVNKPAVIEFFDNAHVDEIFRLCRADLGVFFAELGKGFLDGVEGRVRFLGHQAGKVLITVFQSVVVVGLDVFCRSLFC